MVIAPSESKGIEVLLARAREYIPEEKLGVLKKAYEFAMKAHDGQLRRSGDPFLEHPVETAYILLSFQFDYSTLAAALLHDVVEDCGIPITTIENQFGAEIAKLVDGVTKLSKVLWVPVPGTEAKQKAEKRLVHAENLRKMLVSMAEDLRVVFIKLADRLHNMRTLEAMPPQKRYEIAQETMEIYSPLAHRLGIWELKWQLEDLAFRFLEPQKYRHVANLLVSRRAEREKFIEEVTSVLKRDLDRSGIKAQVFGRPKHIYSIAQKIDKYAAQGKHFDDIHDLLAVRVLVDTIQDCYTVLGAIHNLWHPLPGEFDDHIANPKDNGYQSLHTTVMFKGTTPLEVQIRTHEMNKVAEYGLAAHWRYKEGTDRASKFEKKLTWLRQLVEWQREIGGAEEFLETIKTDIFKDQVFVFTPKGEIKELPRDSTPLDFAYMVHTELGNKCIGAKVNGKLVSLNTSLNNGEVVEIIASKGEKGPSLDWLNPGLGYVHTNHAREKVRQWFKKQERKVNIEMGKAALEKELKRLGLPAISPEEIARLFKYEDMDEFYAALGYGGITTQQVALKLAAQEGTTQVKHEIATPIKGGHQAISDIQVLGVGDLLTKMGQCCNPVPGDEIIGFVTRTRGVTVHRKDCPNIIHEKEKERLVGVEWGKLQPLYPVTVQVDAWDRVGLLRDISTLVAEEKVNIAKASTTTHEDHTITILLTLDVKSMEQLSVLLPHVEGIKGIINVFRRTGT